MNRAPIAVVVLFALVQAGCGGGGGGSTASIPPSPSPSPSSSPMGCGTVTSTGTGNSTQVVVDGFPCAAGGGANQINQANTPYVSVQICAPGSTTNCQIIDHVILDTGSPGLRIASSALQSSLQPSATGLPVVAGGAAGTSVTECITYVSSFSYGPIVKADVYIAGKLVSATDIQVFGSPSFTTPTACSSQGGAETELPADFGGNGLLGVNFETIDAYSYYYDCSNTATGTCSNDVTYAGIPNVVSQFSADNNGIAITLPAVGATGSTTPVLGTLYFGIGTQSDNTPPSTTWALAADGNILDASGNLNPNYTTFAASVGGAWTTGYLDTGTDVTYFSDSAITPCLSTNTYYGYFCPATAQSVAFGLASTGTTSPAYTLNYSVVDPNTLGYGVSTLAVSNIGGPSSTSSTLTDSTFAFGLSTFFGHTVYVLFNGMTAPGTVLTGTGPVNGYD